MNWSNIWWIPYLLIVFTRVVAFRARMRIPTLRGPDTFLGLRVPPDFYFGPGRRLMRSYYIGIIIPPVLEAVVLAPVIRWGQAGWMMTAIFATSMTLAFVGRWNVKRICRAAKPYAVEVAEPAGTVSLQFETRRLTNYRSWPMEVFAWAFDVSAAILIFDSVRLALGIEKSTVHSGVSFLLHLAGMVKNDEASARFSSLLFWPLVLIYIQVGALLMKYAVLAWPLRVFTEATEESRSYREGVRRYLIRTCDWFRIVFAFTLLTAAIELRFPEIAGARSWEWFSYSLSFVFVIAIFSWYLINAKLLFHRARQLKSCGVMRRTPVAPDPSRFRLGGLAFYDPDSPSVLIPSRAGYALNFADRRAYISIAYVMGLAILAFIHLRFGWG